MTNRTITASCLMALSAAIALSSCPSAESLAFDVSSRTSSAFAPSPQTPFAEPSSGSRTPSASSSRLTMKVSSQKNRNRSSKSSSLIETNNRRIQTAGRPGTKKFTDPNKVFCGNLPFDATEDDVMELFSDHWNVPLESVGDRIESVKIIRDWKTGKSKGYGFIQFYEPMVATSAMESVNKGKGKGWRIKGRKMRLDQGKRNPSDDEEYAKKKKKQQKERQQLDEEGMVIHSVLADVEGSADDTVVTSISEDDDEEDEEEEDGMMSEDDMITFIEKGGLRSVMPLTEETAGFLGIEGLYDDDEGDFDFEEFYNENGYDEGDFEEGAELEIDDEDDGEEIVYDGVFEEEYNPKEFEGMTEEEEEKMKVMNREQRREAQKKRKRRKLPFRGFGSRAD